MHQTKEQGFTPKAFTALSLALLPIIVFYALLWHSMRNIPIIDDYHTIMEFALTLKQLPGMGRSCSGSSPRSTTTTS
jgi:hypothetical protein